MKDYHLTVPGPKVCAVCGSWDDLQVHHKNGDHNDDRPENLEWRCREKCHAKEAHKHHIPKPQKPGFKERFETDEDTTFEFKPNWRDV